MNKKLQKQYIKNFRTALQSATENIYSASKIYVEAIDSDPDFKETFQEAFQETIPTSAWIGFENVGRGVMHQKLLFGGGVNSQYIKKLGISDQDKILNGTSVKMLTSTGDTLMVDAREISKLQANQIFNGSAIRTITEQRAYIESLKSKSVLDATMSDANGMPYEIIGNRFVVRANKSDQSFSKAQIKRMFKKWM